MKSLLASAFIICVTTVYGFKMPQGAPPPEVVDVGVYYSPIARSGVCANIRLPLGCSISNDCSAVNCKCPFGGQNFEVELRINKCESPVTLTAGVKVPLLNIDFGHTFPTSQRLLIPIPQIGIIPPIRVFINVKMSSGPTNVKLVVSLETQLFILPIKLDLINGNLPITTASCGGGGGGVLPPGPPVKMLQGAPAPEVVDLGVYYSPMARSGVCGSIRLPLGCSISNDCSTVNCKCPFGGQNFEVELRINKCESPVTLTAGVKIPLLNINFGHTFPTSQRLLIPIPQIGIIPPIRVFINVKMSSGPTNVKLVVSLETQLFILPIKLDLINGNLPITTASCGGGGGGVLPPGPPVRS